MKDKLFKDIESSIYSLYDIVDYFRNIGDEENAEYWGDEIYELEKLIKQLKKECEDENNN